MLLYAFHLWKSLTVNKNTVLHWLEKTWGIKAFFQFTLQKGPCGLRFAVSTRRQKQSEVVSRKVLPDDWLITLDWYYLQVILQRSKTCADPTPITEMCAIDKLLACVYSLIVEAQPSNKNVMEWKNKHMALIKYIPKVCIPAREISSLV